MEKNWLISTAAEEDAANEAAIAQALWELVQEDEKVKYGTSYIHPTAIDPTGNGGGSVFEQPQSGNSYRSTVSGVNPPPVPTATKPESPPNGPDVEEVWACEICTLHNPASYLTCDACGTERSTKNSRELASNNKGSRAVVDLTSPASTKKRGTSSLARPSATSIAKPTWICSFCGNEMERQWWTCSSCGKMKDNSR